MIYKINEAHGVVQGKDKDWKQLSECIIDYIYDLDNGLNVNPNYTGDRITIDMNEIVDYYKRVNNLKSLPDGFIPEWVNHFQLTLDEESKTKGLFVNDFKLVDGKLVFRIVLNNSYKRTAESMVDTLIHEFRHAYTKYINLSKNTNIKTHTDQKIYNSVQKQLHENPLDTPSITKYNSNNDVLILDYSIYNNAEALAKYVLLSIYYIDKEELTSYYQEYNNQIERIINNNKEDIESSIRQSNKLKFDFNKLTRPEQFASNIMNNISVSPFQSSIYKIYKSYQLLWENIFKADDEILEKTIDLVNRNIKLFLNTDLTKKLIKFQGDERTVFKNLQEKILNRINSIIYKMDRLFAIHILELDESISDNTIHKMIKNNK